VRLSALRSGRPLPPQEYLCYSCLLEAETTPRATVRLEGWSQFKTAMTSSGIERATFGLYSLNICWIRKWRIASGYPKWFACVFHFVLPCSQQVCHSWAETLSFCSSCLCSRILPIEQWHERIKREKRHGDFSLERGKPPQSTDKKCNSN
jgi:hypothetical protein